MVPLARLAEVLAAVLILAMGVLALVESPWRGPWKDRTAIWFGLVACLYGVRLAGESPLLRPYAGDLLCRYVDAFITYTILVPVGLFAESLLGPGWRFLLRRLWQTTGMCALASVLWDLGRNRPGSLLWFNRPLVLIAGSLIVAHLLWHWLTDRLRPGYTTAAAGAVVFLGVAVYQTLGGAYRLEPLAMLVFVGSVGHLVARRMLDGERRLVAVSRELELAREIQASILPREVPSVAGVDTAAGYFPCGEVGGDFYDFAPATAHGLGLIVADVSGHGVPAALVASMVKVAFAAEADGVEQPGHVLTRINQVLCGKFTGAYVTACCAHVEPGRGVLRIACAGHPSPWILRRDGALERLHLSGLLLAFDPRASYETSEVPIRAGDRLVFLSDGLVEATNATGEFFGESVFPRLIADGRLLAAKAFLDHTVASLQAWIPSPHHLQDDVTVIVVDVRNDMPPVADPAP